MDKRSDFKLVKNSSSPRLHLAKKSWKKFRKQNYYFCSKLSSGLCKFSTKNFERENTRPQEFKLSTKERAVKRAMFNFEVAAKLYIIEIKKKQMQRLQKIIEEEEVRRLRKEMIPKAQLMPYFDRPFYPQRSTKPLTVPKDPSFIVRNSSCDHRGRAMELIK